LSLEQNLLRKFFLEAGLDATSREWTREKV
jgi:hypothetical protein